MATPIRSAMTSHPYAIPAEAPLLDARKLMLEHRLRHLPAVRGSKLVGLISDRDIKLVLGPEFAYPDPRELTVADVMVPDPYLVDEGTELATVLRHMTDAHLGAVLVTRAGELAGIFTAMDACRRLAEVLEAGDGNTAS